MLSVSDTPNMKAAPGSSGGRGWGAGKRTRPTTDKQQPAPDAFARVQQGPSGELSHFPRPPSFHHPSLHVTCLLALEASSDPLLEVSSCPGLCTMIVRLRFTSKRGQHVLTASVRCRPPPGAIMVPTLVSSEFYSECAREQG